MGQDVPDRPLTGRRSPRRREYLEVLLVAVVVALYARTFLLQAFRVPSDSMAPNLVAGDHVLVNKFVFTEDRPWLPVRGVRRNDVVVFRLGGEPRQLLVKRCVALGGDVVELRDKVLLVNGIPQPEPWVVHRDPRVYPRSRFAPSELRTRDNFGPLRVPPGHLFCLGDNRDESRDSRSFGAVRESDVFGRPLLVYWSTADSRPHLEGGDALRRSRIATFARRLARIVRPRSDRLFTWAN